MSIIHRSEIPDDLFYYRSSSLVYQEYLEKYNAITTMKVAPGQFGWKKKIFGNFFGVVKFERVDVEPTLDFLRERGFRHGMLIWVPNRRTDIPAGWRKLWLPTHFTRTGYSILEEEYYKKWNERARRARKKFLQQANAEIRLVEPEEFVRAFKSVRVRHPYKSDYIKYFNTMVSIDASSLRNYVCYINEKAVAGLTVHDYGGYPSDDDGILGGSSSVHLLAFTAKEAKASQAGTGLIDRWFADSLEKNIKYMSFDHLRDSPTAPDQQGYTDFKLNFLDYEVRFKESYFKFV